LEKTGDAARPALSNAAPPLPCTINIYRREIRRRGKDARVGEWEVKSDDARTLYIAPTYFANPPRRITGRGERERPVEW